MRRLLNNKGGVDSLPLMFFLLVACIFVYLFVDIYGYISLKQKITMAANEMIEIMKAENGFDATNKQQFDNFVQKLGLDPLKISVNGTPKLVQRGTAIDFVARMEYECVGLKPFGKTVKIPIEVTANGLAHTFIR